MLSTKKEINKAIGGYSESKNVSNNKLIVENNKDIQIFAIETGKSDKGDVNVINNKTIVKGGKIKYVNGGVASEGNAEGNTVIIENGTIEKKL
ncbi:hypothetical protein F2N08_07465 [Campylobacter hyointestinalis subsp. hyointestinalis]|nr:hypothetical protein [Campylobacter hyointestinalis subsp. hyointestinalis]